MKLLRKLFSGFIIFFLCCMATAQTQIPNVNADYMKLDPYGNIYAVKGAQLFKFSIDGKLLSQFSDHTLGTISSIDVFNPMKIMLFYKDAGTLVFLNEQLAHIQDPIYLFDYNYYTISLASYSAANQIHLYDHVNKYLLTLDFFMRELYRTPLNFPAFHPIQMIELEEKSLAFHVPDTGIYLLDSFGTFNKLLRMATEQPVVVTGDLIYYSKNNEVVIYNYKTLSTDTQQLPISDVAQALFYRNKMVFLLNDGTLWIYINKI